MTGPQRLPQPRIPADPEQDLPRMVREILRLLGENPEREGLHTTPARVSSSLTWLTRGYTQTADEVIGDAVFEEEYDAMVVVRDMEFYSLCEHHLLPFFGTVHVAYVPDGRIVGLSKVPRVVEVFARRLQVQERLTDEIADAIQHTLRPAGVGVVVQARHLCMMMRGIQSQGSVTVTSSGRGVFRTDAAIRDEFVRLVLG